MKNLMTAFFICKSWLTHNLQDSVRIYHLKGFFFTSPSQDSGNPRFENKLFIVMKFLIIKQKNSKEKEITDEMHVMSRQ